MTFDSCQDAEVPTTASWLDKQVRKAIHFRLFRVSSRADITVYAHLAFFVSSSPQGRRLLYEAEVGFLSCCYLFNLYSNLMVAVEKDVGPFEQFD